MPPRGVAPGASNPEPYAIWLRMLHEQDNSAGSGAAEHELLKKRFTIKEHFPTQFAVRDSASGRLVPTDAATFQWLHSTQVDPSDVLVDSTHAYVDARQACSGQVVRTTI